MSGIINPDGSSTFCYQGGGGCVTTKPNPANLNREVSAMDRLNMIVQMPSFWIVVIVLLIVYVKSK
jgi:hypothetical protein